MKYRVIEEWQRRRSQKIAGSIFGYPPRTSGRYASVPWLKVCRIRRLSRASCISMSKVRLPSNLIRGKRGRDRSARPSACGGSAKLRRVVSRRIPCFGVLTRGFNFYLSKFPVGPTVCRRRPPQPVRASHPTSSTSLNHRAHHSIQPAADCDGPVCCDRVAPDGCVDWYWQRRGPDSRRHFVPIDSGESCLDWRVEARRVV